MSWLSDVGHVVVHTMVKRAAGKTVADAVGTTMEAVGAAITGHPMPKSSSSKSSD